MSSSSSSFTPKKRDSKTKDQDEPIEEVTVGDVWWYLLNEDYNGDPIINPTFVHVRVLKCIDNENMAIDIGNSKDSNQKSFSSQRQRQEQNKKFIISISFPFHLIPLVSSPSHKKNGDLNSHGGKSNVKRGSQEEPLQRQKTVPRKALLHKLDVRALEEEETLYRANYIQNDLTLVQDFHDYSVFNLISRNYMKNIIYINIGDFLKYDTIILQYIIYLTVAFIC